MGHTAQLPGVGFENIQAPGNCGGDIRREELGDLDNIVKRFAALQTLRHARQQFPNRPVGIALLFKTLTRQAIFAENTDRLRHIANLIDLRELGSFDGIIL